MAGTDVRRVVIVLVSLIIGAVAGPAFAQGLPRVDGPLTMDQAVDLALAKGLRVKSAAAEARVMDTMRREALAPFWPQVSANGYFNDQRMRPNVYFSAGDTMARNYQVFDADRTRNTNVTAMYPLFSGGRDWYGYQAAARRSEAAREMLRGTEVDVAMQARLDYVTAIREAENLRVTRDLRRDVEERVRVTREMVAAGRVARFNLLRDEAELANVVQMEAMAQSRAEQALVALKTTMGLDLASALTLADRLEYRPLDVSVEEGIREATASQPEVRAAVKQREAAEAEVRAAYGNYFPQVSVSYMYDWAVMRNRAWESQMDGTRMPADSSEGYSAGVVITLPIFDGFRREAALDGARARRERAVHAEGLARQQVAKEVTQAALMLAAAEKSIEASRKGLERAEEDFRVVQERFAAGRGIQLEVLDAQVAMVRARFNAIAVLADYESARAMWLRAAGRVR